MSLDERRRAALLAAVERIVPTDDDPGAREAGTIRHVLSRASATRATGALYAEGADRLDRLAEETVPGASFGDLSPEEQDRILADLDGDRDPFFRRLVIDTLEGFYGDPRHGGNDGGVSWRMLGFPGPTAGVGYRPPLGWYDANTPESGPPPGRLDR